jgi:hypothetical protein
LHETAVLQRLLEQFPTRINGENISTSREFLAGNRDLLPSKNRENHYPALARIRPRPAKRERLIPRAMAPRLLTILTGRKPAENPAAERACRCG